MLMDEKLPSVKTYSPEQIAAHHGVPVESIYRQLEMGVQVEQEHVTDPETAREIALDHLLELPDYYTRLDKMENEDIQEMRRRAGIAEARDPTDIQDFPGILIRFRELGGKLRGNGQSEVAEKLDTHLRALRRWHVRVLAEDAEVHNIRRLAGLTEDDDEDDDDREYYGHETDTEGQEKEEGISVSNYQSDLDEIHGELITCWTDLRKCVMACIRKGHEVPDTMRTTLDKLGRTLENIESKADKSA